MPDDFSAYEPPPKVRQFWMAYLAAEERTMTAILQTAGLSWKWFYESFQPDEQAVAWFNAQQERMFNSRCMDVYNALYYQALEGNPQAAKIFVERFDPKYRPESGMKHTIEVRMRPDDPADRMARLRERLAPAPALPNSTDGVPVVQVEIGQPENAG